MIKLFRREIRPNREIPNRAASWWESKETNCLIVCFVSQILLKINVGHKHEWSEANRQPTGNNEVGCKILCGSNSLG